MKKSLKQLLTIQIFMLLVIITGFFYGSIFENNLEVLFLLVSFIALYSVFKIDLKNDYKYKQILKIVITCLLFYFVFIYVAGLFTGFAKTIYTFNFNNFIYNIIPTIIYIILMECIRTIYINKSNNNKIIIILSCIIFILYDSFSKYYLYDFKVSDELYEYIGLIVLTSIARNIFLTILCSKSNVINCVIYRIITEIYIFLVPIVPNFGPYINSVLEIALPLIIGLILIRPPIRILASPKKSKYSRTLSVVITAILLLIVLLNSGFIKYQMFVIGSNSMNTYIYRGDVIIARRTNNKEIKNIKKGEILVFRYNNKIISHRVYKIIKRDNKLYFKTKGDNNDQVDDNIVKEKDIIGTVSFRIKYIGLPSIWLREALQ
ncbi:signal peptidase I [Clostridium sp. CAG:433]|nr:signal peptidase I [Clostridium sp. CAG:433]